MATALVGCQEMKTAGLFERLPRMLAAIGPVYRHGQSFQQMCGWGRFTDQRQFLYERLVGICAGAAMCAPPDLCGTAVTPDGLVVAPGVAARPLALPGA